MSGYQVKHIQFIPQRDFIAIESFTQVSQAWSSFIIYILLNLDHCNATD